MAFSDGDAAVPASRQELFKLAPGILGFDIGAFGSVAACGQPPAASPLPTSVADASAATRLPRSIALLKISLGCPCAVTALLMGPDGNAQRIETKSY
jgi:hypothetical protein